MALSKALVEKINYNTRKCTDFFDFAEPYQVVRSLKTEGELELEEVNFYEGYKNVGLEIMPRKTCSNSDEYEPRTSESEWRLQEQRNGKVRLPIELNGLLNNFSKGHVSFVGPAGIGKTTLMKSIARNVLDKKYKQLEEVELVHFVQCRYFERDHVLTIGKLLFHSTGVTADEIASLVQFTIRYPEKVLFILDSLDTLPYTVDGVYKYITHKEEGCPEAVLSSFLSGKLLAGCRIITSSREHSIRNYVGEIRPQKVITLRGFSNATIKQVIAGYVGDEADEIYQHLENEMPDILALCSTPVTLVYTLIGLKAGSDLEPTTTTAILAIVLQSIMRSPHTRLTQAEVLEMMQKLEELSHLGNMEGIVYFTYEYFRRVEGLNPEKATDLAIMAPAGIPQKLMQGEGVLFFSHQTFQEMLGALWVARNNENFFNDFLKSINLPRYAVIRKYLYGTMLDHDVHKAVCKDLLSEDYSYEKKVELLKENLRAQLAGGLTLAPLLELLISMNEAKDGITDVIRSCLPKVDMQGIPLSTTDIFCVGSVVSRCEQLQCLNLRHCSLDASLIKTLASALRRSAVQILRLHFGGNPNLGSEGVAAAEEIAHHCRSDEFDMSDCNLSGDLVIVLADGKLEKLVVLNLSWNANLGISGIEAAGRLTTRCHVEDLQLRSCGLCGKQLQALAIATKDTKALRKLRLGGNRNLGKDGVFSSGEIVSNCNSEELDLSGCSLSNEQIQALAFATRRAKKLRVLNLSDRMEATREVIRSVARLLPNVKEVVQLQWWKISKPDLQFLQKELNHLGQTAPKVLLTSSELQCQMNPLADTEIASPRGENTGESPISDSSMIDDDAQVDRKMLENLSRPISTSKLIGKDGGKVRVRGCEADFSAGTLDEDITISLTARTEGSEIPKKYEAISPELHCRAPSNLQFSHLVTMKLPLYRKNIRGEIIILCKEAADKEWKELDSECVEDDGSVVFKVGHFSLMRAVMRALFGDTEAVNFLYYKQSTAQLYGLTCLDDEGIKTSSVTSLENGGYKSVIEIPDRIVLENDEKVGYSLKISSPPGHNVDPSTDVEFTAQEIYKSKCLSRKFVIVPMPEAGSDLLLSYTLKKPNTSMQTSVLRLNESVLSRPIPERQDPTARVWEEEILGSSEDAYRDHFDDPDIYQISLERQKGNVLIINNDFQRTREGSENDVRNMNNLWNRLGFNVEQKLNLSKAEMRNSCVEFAQRAQNVSLVVTIIMSHGGKGEDGSEYFLGNNGERVLVSDLVGIYSSSASPHLNGIPKLFLFQACRGKKGDYVWHEVQTDASPELRRVISANKADMLISFPTESGYKALRDTRTGSWLMNAITNIFTQRAHDTHVLDMLTMVNAEVGGKITDTRQVQASNQESFFRKKLFLFPGWPNNPV